MTAPPRRVLIVDDSAAVREVLSDLISRHPGLEVMATAADPFQAAERMRREIPDVISLDVEMPRMDGITFLRRLMKQRPIPVVVCSSLVGTGSATMMAALDAGAIDVIAKPAMGTRQFFEDSAIRIQDTLLAASRAKLGVRAPARSDIAGQGVLRPPASTDERDAVVAIGASTGGTEALRYVLESLPPLAPPLIIVQHMPEGFTRAFADRLNRLCRIGVKEAADGDSLLRGQALIAPGNRHVELAGSGLRHFVRVIDGPLIGRHRPSINRLFQSVARHAGRGAVGVIMTGMGSDGAAGLKAMRDAGARTFGQNEASCVVYGMSREAMRCGAVESELPLERIPAAIASLGADTGG